MVISIQRSKSQLRIEHWGGGAEGQGQFLLCFKDRVCQCVLSERCICLTMRSQRTMRPGRRCDILIGSQRMSRGFFVYFWQTSVSPGRSNYNCINKCL